VFLDVGFALTESPESILIFFSFLNQNEKNGKESCCTAGLIINILHAGMGAGGYCIFDAKVRFFWKWRKNWKMGKNGGVVGG
jgi:hypothetical protein